MANLLKNATTNGDGDTLELPGNVLCIFQVAGTWDGATVTVKGSLDGGVTFTEPANEIGRFTSDAIESLNFQGPCKIKATVSNKSSSTNLSAWIQPTVIG